MVEKGERKPLRLGTAQFDAVAGDIAANAASHARLIEQAGDRGVDVLVFPELSLGGYDLDGLARDPERYIVDPDGPALTPVRDACRRHGVIAVAGGCLPNRRGMGLSALVFGRDGGLLTSYDKRHLDGPERDHFVPGTAPSLLEVDGWRLGLGICYDASFPEHARELAMGGAAAYLVSGAFFRGESEHRRGVYFPARALENTIYVAFANYVGSHGGLRYAGRSTIHGPDGRLLADAGPDRPGLAVAEIYREKLAQTRERLPMLRDRMED